MTNEVETITKRANWWPRRSALEKSLIVVTVLALICIAALGITLLVIPINNVQHNKTNYVCQSPGCIQAASLALEKIDNSVKPCDDFYNYACGNFLKNTVIPDDKVGVNSFSVIDNKLQEQLRVLISDKINPTDPKPFNLAKNYYQTCMNKTLIEERGLTPLTDILGSLGGWPVVVGDRWDVGSTWTWIKAIKDFRKIGFTFQQVFSLYVDIDMKDATKHIIEVDQASVGLNRAYLVKGLSDKVVKAYYDYMVDVAVIFGANKSQAEKELLDSLNFEIALANISLPREERRNYTALYNPFTVREVQKKYPYIPWVEYINALLPTGVNIDDNEVISVVVPSFFEKLGQLLQETPERTIANYLLWRITAYSVSFLNEDLRKRELVFSTITSGKQEQAARWKECVQATSQRLYIAVGAQYVQKHFREDAKLIALEMVNGIRQEFINILHKVTWMDERTRQAALNKVNAIVAHIGYPDEILNNNKIENHYEKLKFEPGNYLVSALHRNAFGTDLTFNKLRTPTNQTDWVTHAMVTIVNAFYSSTENSIQFPAGILQGHFFSAYRPRYLNYGAIGFVIGHEITHGFDDQGSQFDLNGNLIDWWQADTKAQYLEKAKCIIEQYGNYTEPTTQLKLNGINTQGENIADNGGLKESYYAYQKWVHDHGAETKLPGLDLSPQQLFWLSAAQTWCAVYRPEAMKRQITTGVHSPPRFRVIGPLSNMKEFAKDFNCPVGSPMNPVHKCEVW